MYGHMSFSSNFFPEFSEKCSNTVRKPLRKNDHPKKKKKKIKFSNSRY